MLESDYEQIQVFRDAAASSTAVIAIHSTRLGPAFGGIRRWRYSSVAAAVADAQRLARAMTLKCAIAGVPGGGGKAVLLDHPQLGRVAAYARLGRQVEQLGGAYYTGSDVGTEAADLEVVARATRYVARPGPDGPGDLAVPTARGVFKGIEAVAAHLGVALDGLHVAVQGLGAVGERLAGLLCRAGVRLSVADLDPARVARAVEQYRATAVPTERILEHDCDVFAPCALGGLVDQAVVPRLRTRAIAGSANNVLCTAAAGVALAARGILYAPDFVINAGALVHGALFHLEGQAPPVARVDALGATLAEVFATAAQTGVPPEVVAERLACARAGIQDLV